MVGLFTGIFAKETVIASLDALYAAPAEEAAEGDAEAPPAEILRAGASGAWEGLVQGFRNFDVDLVDLPATGEAAPEAAAESLGVRSATFRAMRQRFGSRAAAFAYMLFVLIYVPCCATLAAIRREAGWNWMWFEVVYLTGLAWVTATIFYQVCTFGAHPVASSAWIAAAAALAALFASALKRFADRRERMREGES
ncbi:nucleoside recognition domain-containing protein [Kiritimatiella glycovorans]|uniref:Ferrous iron transport protein B n=1 Tax=Kiritimatiella glycovorans TaxID=1307763 RepID=A0A0G3EFZ6_9BACT|nr:Ferrous iron transport protein B [Kiritimatiella glycovorans]